VHHLVAADGVKALMDALLDQGHVALARLQAEQPIVVRRPGVGRQS
jgi:hypothetical protein